MSNIIIIGAGMAGITCAVQLKMLGLTSIVIEKNNIGGLIGDARHIENIPFFDKYVSGQDVVNMMKGSAEKHKIRIIKDNIKKIYTKGRSYELMGLIDMYRCKYLVIATGTIPILNEGYLPGKHIHYSPVFQLYENKNICILGGGDIALDYALSVNETAESTALICRSYLKANDSLIKKVNKSSINVSQYTGIIDFDAGNSLLHTNKNVYSCNYLLTAIGREPFLPHIPDNIDKKNMYIIGDAGGGTRMLLNAGADGINCALSIYEKEKK